MSGGDVRARIRQLILSGDNTLKNRHDDARFVRARARFHEAHALAVGLGAEDLVALIELRLADLEGAPPPGPTAA